MEAEFQKQVVDLARALGWEPIYHTHDSRLSESGFPDLVMFRGDRQLVPELKRGDRRTTTDQRKYLAAFLRTGAEAVVWRPDPDPKERWPLVETSEPLPGLDFGAIQKRLQ